jgi:hypothetical protein
MRQPYAVGVEAFFVVVMAAVLAGVGLWALAMVRQARTLTDRNRGDE